MSVRFPFESQHQRCAPTPLIGGIYGQAIGLPVGGLWVSMAVSPPRSPPMLPATTPTLIVESLDLNNGTACTDDTDDSDESPVLEQICPLWVHDLATQAPALLLFDQTPDASETTLLQSHPRRLRVRGVVTPRPVAARSLTWRPLVDAGEVVGVVFLLGSGRDADDEEKPPTRMRGRGNDAVARIEVRSAASTAAQDGLGSVAVVQSSYSPLAMVSGMADPSSYLLYTDPEAHLASMRNVRTQLQQGEDVGYVPSRELCVTSAFDRLVLRANTAETTDHNDDARRAWQTTKLFLKTLSALTADSVVAYNAAEIDRTNAFELRHAHGSWRGSVV